MMSKHIQCRPKSIMIVNKQFDENKCNALDHGAS
jgi:hypothetical protein